MGMIRPITSPIPSKSPHFSLHHQFCFWKIQQFFGTTLQWFKIIEGLYYHRVFYFHDKVLAFLFLIENVWLIDDELSPIFSTIKISFATQFVTCS